MGKMEKTWCTILLAISLAATVTSDDCKRTGVCKCQNSTHYVDLNPLSNGPNPRFTVQVGTNIYYISPCSPLKQSECNAGYKGEELTICQDVSNTTYYDAGDYKSDKFTGDPATGNFNITFTGGKLNETRTSIVSLICDKNTLDIKFLSESPIRTYNFELRASEACAIKLSKNDSGLSTGSILVIIFVVLFIAYWIGGFLFMKFARRAEGLETIPNYEFWKELPLLIRDGAVFTSRGCKGETTYEKI